MKEFKQQILIVLLFTSHTCVNSQQVNDCKNIIYDIDSIPVLICMKSNTNKYNSDSLFYLLPNGESIRVDKNIEFWNGESQLVAYFDFMYYQRFNYNHHEMNDIIRYCIIFDNYQTIRDIRFLKRFNGTNDKIKNYLMVYKILSSTEGQWVKQRNTYNSWFVYFGSHKFF